MPITRTEQVTMIRNAQEKLSATITLLDAVVRDGPENQWAYQYLVRPLEILASAKHRHDSISPNLDDWMAQILKEERDADHVGSGAN